MNENNRQRLFVDMDGTLAVFKPVDTLETLYEKGYFKNLEPNPNVISAIRDIIRNRADIDVFILSSVLSDSPYAQSEKNEWLDRYLPELPPEKRVFPACGEDKKSYIPGGIRTSDCLLDDYSYNLHLWEPPAKGIKLLNGINGTKGSWKNDKVAFNRPPTEISDNIVSSMRSARSAEETQQNSVTSKPELPKISRSDSIGRLDSLPEDYLKQAMKSPDVMKEHIRRLLQLSIGSSKAAVQIQSQIPSSLYVQPFLKWRLNGFEVNKNARPIYLTKNERQQSLLRDGKPIPVSLASDSEQKKIISGETPTTETIKINSAVVYDIKDTNCPESEYERFTGGRFKELTHAEVYSLFVTAAVQLGVTVNERAPEILAIPNSYNAANASITISPSQRDNVKLMGLCQCFAEYMVDKTSLQPIGVKEIERDMLSLKLIKAFDLPPQDSLLSRAAERLTSLTGHSIKTLDGIMERMGRAENHTLTAVHEAQSSSHEAIKEVRAEEVSKNFVRDL